MYSIPSMLPYAEVDCAISQTPNKMAFTSTMIADVHSLNCILIFMILLMALT